MIAFTTSRSPFSLVCMSSGGTKRKMAPTIGTHSAFHCDEALGCFLLKRTKLLKDAGVVRSRDPAVLKDCDVVIDVGGVYDPSECPCSAAAIWATGECMPCNLSMLGPTNSSTVACF